MSFELVELFSISLPLTLPLSFPSHLSFPTPEKTRTTNSHDSGSRVSPAPLSPPALPSQQGKFFFSFFSQFIFFFEQCSTFRPRWLPPLPTAAPQHLHLQGPLPQPPWLDTQSGFSPTYRYGAQYPVTSSEQVSSLLTVPVSQYTHPPHLPPRHLTVWWSSPRRLTARWPPLHHVTQRRSNHHVTGARTLGVPHLASSPGPHLVAQQCYGRHVTRSYGGPTLP